MNLMELNEWNLLRRGRAPLHQSPILLHSHCEEMFDLISFRQLKIPNFHSTILEFLTILDFFNNLPPAITNREANLFRPLAVGCLPFNTFPQTTPFPFRLLMKCFHFKD